MSNDNKCIYCGNQAIHQFANKKWCCSASRNGCPVIRQKKREATKKSWSSGTRGTSQQIKRPRRPLSTLMSLEEQEETVKMFKSGASLHYIRSYFNRGRDYIKKALAQKNMFFGSTTPTSKNRLTINTSSFFQKNSTTLPSVLKKIIKAHNLMPCDRCWECGLMDWLDKPLTLDMDHIDGDHFNNEISNLRFLCPNCHSQTDTFRAKYHNIGKKKVSDEDLIESLKKHPNINKALRGVGLSSASANYVRANKLKIQHNIIHTTK